MGYSALSRQPDIHDRWSIPRDIGDPGQVNNIHDYPQLSDAVSITWDGMQVILQLERNTGHIIDIYLPYFDTPEGQKMPPFLNDSKLHQLIADWDAFMKRHKIAILPEGGMTIISIDCTESEEA